MYESCTRTGAIPLEDEPFFVRSADDAARWILHREGKGAAPLSGQGRQTMILHHSPEGLEIEARGLTKRYGTTVAVDDLSFDVLPGQVTGFLGPNGAGKSTTLRMILGLDTPSAGSVTIGEGAENRP